ncbi:hypothetical protein [Falsirhodobacter halotolerans]|uniref:hypothetical protein n=1 Tax=Falsirhodobacter halotolerans TaxID=1146892 RepID=UPI001FD4EDB6|nr:hypothetical protein [Falsirhodobacter halotolerans]MCJ8139942.1 hypothetical protein [Falsirhodobacter halotolerans]
MAEQDDELRLNGETQDTEHEGDADVEQVGDTAHDNVEEERSVEDENEDEDEDDGDEDGEEEDIEEQIALLADDIAGWNTVDARTLVRWLNDLGSLCRRSSWRTLEQVIDLSDLPSNRIPAHLEDMEIWAVDDDGMAVVGTDFDLVSVQDLSVDSLNSANDDIREAIDRVKAAFDATGDVDADLEAEVRDAVEALEDAIKAGKEMCADVDVDPRDTFDLDPDELLGLSLGSMAEGPKFTLLHTLMEEYHGNAFIVVHTDTPEGGQFVRYGEEDAYTFGLTVMSPADHPATDFVPASAHAGTYLCPEAKTEVEIRF